MSSVFNLKARVMHEFFSAYPQVAGSGTEHLWQLTADTKSHHYIHTTEVACVANHWYRCLLKICYSQFVDNLRLFAPKPNRAFVA